MSIDSDVDAIVVEKLDSVVTYSLTNHQKKNLAENPQNWDISQQQIEALKREKQDLKEEILDLQVLHT